MPSTPGWKAAVNGLTNNLDATNHAAQISQLLGTHSVTPVYEGAQLVTPSGGANFTWLNYGNATDLDQPITMPTGKTTIGRVTIPINPVGSGADLFVGLYPDSSGSPNTSNLLAGTVIPASWINNLSAPNGLSAGGPLATARFNSFQMTTGVSSVNWASPASGVYGVASSSSTARSGNFVITVGGQDTTPSAVGNVYTSRHVSPGLIQLPVPQPSLPKGLENCAVTTVPGSVVVAGGITGSGIGTNSSSVYVASWDSVNGIIGSWSVQAALPQAYKPGAATSYNNTVYLISGDNGSGSVNIIRNVYYANVVNGQITSWLNGPSLPVGVIFPVAIVVGNWLIVAGGEDQSLGPVSTTYYAPIRADGSLGSWLNGPPLPAPMSTANVGWNQAATDSSVVIVGGTSGSGDPIQVLTVTAAGPSDMWTSNIWTTSPTGVNGQVQVFPLSSGSWEVVSLDFVRSKYSFSQIIPVPTVSVPLSATGLTPGSTYHVVLQQHESASASSYLQYGINSASLPVDAMKSTRHSGTWTTAQAGYSVPITVYDNTPGGPILHTWEDPTNTGSTASSNIASRSSTLIYNQKNLLLGVCEAANLPNDPLNSNPTFTSGTTPWTSTNCTLTQSSAQTHGGYAYSGLMTPNGTSATVYTQCELVPVNSGTSVTGGAQWYTVNGWVYSPTGWSSVSLSVNWYDSKGNYLSTSSNPVSVAATTWTNLVNWFLAPLGAAFASIDPTESGTPAASNTLYLSNVTLAASPELTQALAPVSQITYSGQWPPNGVTQLA